MWYMNNEGGFSWSVDPEVVTYNAMLQEIQLWKGENPIDINAGVDYKNIFDGKVFAKTELDSVIEKYSSSFTKLELGDAITSEDGQTVSFDLTVQFKDGREVRKTVSL